MEDANVPRYKYLKVTRPISVEPCTTLDGSALQRRILVMIMGPTGAGKSSFIEALSGNSDLAIAKDQLEGFTQSVSAFKLVNVITNKGPSGRYPIYLIDTPGFSDPNVSQLEIVQKVERWMRDSQLTAVTHILYFIPINDIRMPGSKRRTLDTFKSLTGVETARDLTIVTSMWDTIWNEPQRVRAERRFCELRDNIWKDFTHQGSQMVKFHNTQDSTLSILNSALSKSSTSQFFSFEDMIDKNLEIRDTPFGGRVYEDLISSIRGLRQKKEGLDAELNDPEMTENNALREFVQGQVEETTCALERFERQLDEFGPPPTDSPPSELEIFTSSSSCYKAAPILLAPPNSPTRSRTLEDSLVITATVPLAGLASPASFACVTSSSSSQYTMQQAHSGLMPRNVSPIILYDKPPQRSTWFIKALEGIKSLCKRILSHGHDS